MDNCRQILCVDDNDDSCELITLMIHTANENCRVTTASSATEALKLIAENPFDLYILDYRLPEMSGLDLCRTIRQTEPVTPIVFFTGMARDVDGKNALDAGATKFLVKPNDLDILTDTVEELLNQKSAGSDYERTANH